MTQNVTLIGHLGDDAKVTTHGERDVCKFSLATKELFGNGNPHTEWHFVDVWAKTGAFDRLMAAGKLKKGARAILLEGAIRNSRYEKDGVVQFSSSVGFQLHPTKTIFDVPPVRPVDTSTDTGANQGQGQAAQGAPAAQSGQAAGQVVQQAQSAPVVQSGPTPAELAVAAARERAAQQAQIAAQELAELEAAALAEAEAKAKALASQSATTQNIGNNGQFDDDIPF